MLGTRLLTALLLAAPAFAQEVVDWTDAASCVGRICSVRGTVVAQEDHGPVYRLYFDAARRDVYATLVRGWLVTWPSYVGHPILASGKVDRFRDSVEVMVRDPGNIDVLDAPQTPTLAPFTAAPPPAVPPTATPTLAPGAPPTIAAPPPSAPPPVAPAAAALPAAAAPAVVPPIPTPVPPALVPPPAAPPATAPAATQPPAAAQPPPAATTPAPSDELERLRQRVRELEKRVEELERRQQ